MLWVQMFNALGSWFTQKKNDLDRSFELRISSRMIDCDSVLAVLVGPREAGAETGVAPRPAVPLPGQVLHTRPGTARGGVHQVSTHSVNCSSASPYRFSCAVNSDVHDSRVKMFCELGCRVDEPKQASQRTVGSVSPR